MLPKDLSKAVFFDVGLFLIVAGAGILSYGAVTWLFNSIANTVFVSPSEKIMGGLIVLGIGYLIIEIELLRKK